MKGTGKSIAAGHGAVICLLLSLCACVPSGPERTGPSEQSGYIVSISAEPEAIPADGGSQALISVLVTDRWGDPVAGVSVFFTATLGLFEGYQYNSSEGEWETSDVPVTSADGRAIGYLRSESFYGTSVVTATVEDATARTYVRFI